MLSSVHRTAEMGRIAAVLGGWLDHSWVRFGGGGRTGIRQFSIAALVERNGFQNMLDHLLGYLQLKIDIEKPDGGI